MYMAHDVPGRLRVKLEKLRNNPLQLSQVKQLLMINGVHRIKTSTLTGSVVVEYDSLTVTSEKIVSLLHENGYSIDRQRRLKERKLQGNHEKIAVTLSRATVSWFAGRVLEANGLSFIAAFI